MKKFNVSFILLATILVAGLSACGGQVQSATVATSSSAELVAIQITPANPSIAVGTSQQFSATGIYSDNTTQDLTASVTWESTDTNIAAVNSFDGIMAATIDSAKSIKVYGKAVGHTSIKATWKALSGSTTLTVTTATLVSLSITPTNPSIALGTIQQFVATGTFSDGTTQDLTTSVNWTSSNAGVAAISNTAGSNGRGSTVSPGSTTITANSGSTSGSTTLTVTPATLVSLAVTPTNPSIALGTSQQFVATGIFSDGTTQNLSGSVNWTSSNTGVATISNAAGFNGVSSTVSPGSTTVTANSGSLSGSTTLTVTPATLVSLAVTPTNPSIALGSTQQFVATGTFSNGTTQNLTTSVNWTSSNTGVASVSNAAGSQGLTTSVSAGSVTIQAATGSITASTSLTVTAATLVSIAVTPANPSIVNGTTRQFTATGTYSNGSTQNVTTSVTWSSSNTGIAMISNSAGTKGLAASVAAGSTTIRATLGSISGSTALTVTTATLVSIAVTPANPSIATGGTQQFTATGTYSNGSTQDLTASATWSSSSTGVATVSNAAGSHGLATAISAGTASMTATSGSVSGSASLTVTGGGSLTISWNAPTTYTDGSSLNLSDLQLFKIYYGSVSGIYDHTVIVLNSGTPSLSQTLTLAPGNYYFTVTSVDILGQESNYSNEVNRTI